MRSTHVGRRVGGFGFLAAALIAITPANVFATPLNVSGGGVLVKGNTTGNLIGVTSVPQCIAFSGATTCAVPPASTSFNVSGSDPLFALGTSGTIKDIGTTFPIVAFETVTLTSGGPAFFDLLGIIPPNPGLPACVAGSAACQAGVFSFVQQSATQVNISLALNEIGYTGTSASGFTAYTGIFSTNLSGSDLSQYATGCSGAVTIANILTCEGTGHTIKSGWTGTQSPVPGVPEPASLSMMGLGLLGLGLVGRRKLKA